MKFIKLTSIATGLAVLAATLLPAAASALGTATMSLAGATTSDGKFSVIVDENTGSDTVTGANVELSFSQAVSGVSYDYSVGPFTAVTPSGAHNAYGTVTGLNHVARVTFTLANPGTVTASVDGNSYLKHAGDTSVESFAINRGSADFTYTAPASTNNGNTSTPTPTPTTTSSTPAASTSASTKSTTTTNKQTTTSATSTASDAVKGAATTTPSATTNTTSKPGEAAKTAATAVKRHSHTWAWAWLIAVLAIVAGYFAARRYRTVSGKQAEEVAAKKPAPVKATKASKPAGSTKKTRS